MSEQRDNADDQSGKQGRARGQSVQAVDQIERVGNQQDPYDGQRQSDEPSNVDSAGLARHQRYSKTVHI